jgi:hypothetical protein
MALACQRQIAADHWADSQIQIVYTAADTQGFSLKSKTPTPMGEPE